MRRACLFCFWIFLLLECQSAQNEIHLHVFPGMFQYIGKILFWLILIGWAVKILKYAHFSLSFPVLRATTTAQTLQTWLYDLKTDFLLIRISSYLLSFTLVSFTSGDYLPDKYCVVFFIKGAKHSGLKSQYCGGNKGGLWDVCVTALIRAKWQRRKIYLDPTVQITGSGRVSEQEMTALS